VGRRSERASKGSYPLRRKKPRKSKRYPYIKQAPLTTLLHWKKSHLSVYGEVCEARPELGGEEFDCNLRSRFPPSIRPVASLSPRFTEGKPHFLGQPIQCNSLLLRARLLIRGQAFRVNAHWPYAEHDIKKISPVGRPLPATKLHRLPRHDFEREFDLFHRVRDDEFVLAGADRENAIVAVIDDAQELPVKDRAEVAKLHIFLAFALNRKEPGDEKTHRIISHLRMNLRIHAR
jgi:hypothetical protein